MLSIVYMKFCYPQLPITGQRLTSIKRYFYCLLIDNYLQIVCDHFSGHARWREGR